MAIALILDSNGNLAQIADATALQADKFERKQASGNLVVGSTLAAEELQLGSSSSLIRLLGDGEVDGFLEFIDTVIPDNPDDGRGRLYKKSGDDGLFWLPDSTGAEVDLTDSVSPSGHRILDQLTHNLDEDYYEEYTYNVSGSVSNTTFWTDSGKTLKIREYDYTYAGGKMTQSVEKQYDGSGTLVETLTKTYTWASSRITSITCIRS